ncbi:MAG TPA: hypothetical protein VKD90_27255 [Gemmataceae bacterium]|nr:hypothetical protein [Gemmataceae bacterium]
MRRLVVPAFLLALFAAGTAEACFLKCLCGKRAVAPVERELTVGPYLAIVSVDGKAPNAMGQIEEGIDSTRDLEVVVESNIQTLDPGPDLILTDEGPHTGFGAATAVGFPKKYKRYKHEKKIKTVLAPLADAVTVWHSSYKIPETDLEPGRNYRLDAKYPGIDSDTVRFWTLAP